MEKQEKYVLRYQKKGYTQSQLDEAARVFGEQNGLREPNWELYNDFGEMAVFGKDENGRVSEITMTFRELERLVKKLEG